MVQVNRSSGAAFSEPSKQIQSLQNAAPPNSLSTSPTVSLFAEETVQTAPPSGLASARLDFVEHNPQVVLSHFEDCLDTTFATQNIPSVVQERLKANVHELKTALSSGTQTQQQDALNLLMFELRQTGLLKGPVRLGLENIQTQVLKTRAHDTHQSIEPIHLGSRLIGYSGSDTLRNEGNAFVRTLRQQEKMPENTTRQTLLLMSLRDEMLRRQFELAQGNPKGPMVAPDIEEELPLIENTVHMLDQALASTRDLPPNMLADLQDTVRRISEAKPGEALHELSNSLGGIKAPTGINTPSLGHKSITAPKPGQVERPTLPPELNRIAAELAQNAGKPMPNMHEHFGSFIQNYAQVMNVVEQSIPPLYFPLTLPIPLMYNDGNTAFIMPPGTQLSQDHTTGQYTAHMPGFLVLTDGTTVASQNINLNLGPDLDGIQAGQVDIFDGDTHTQLHGVTAAISRSQQTALIEADQISINDADGSFLLTNARISQTPERFEASMDSLDMPEGSMGQTSIAQYNDGDTAYLDAQTHNLNWIGEGQSITADQLTLNMAQGPNGQQILMNGTNVQIQDGNSLISATSGQLQIQNNADGSGLIDLQGEGLSWQDGNQYITSPGQTHLALTRHSEGYIESLNIEASELNYLDGERFGQVSDGQMTAHFDSTGALQSANISADSVQWRDGEQLINATQGQLDLNYDEDGNLDLSGQVAQLDYRSGNDFAQILGGNVSLQTQENQISGLTASADRVFWKDDTQQLLAHDANLNLNTHNNGQIAHAELLTGQVNYQNNTDLLSINGSQATLDFNENGLLQAGNLALGDIDYTGEIGHLQTSGQTQINGTFHDNGQLASLNVESEDFTFSNNDLSASAQNTQIQITANAGGQLESLAAQTGNLNVQGEWGNLQAEGQSTLNMTYANDQLATVNATSEHLNFTNEKGALSLDGASLDMNFVDGNLQNATGHTDSGSFNGDFGQINLAQGDIDLTFTDQQLQGIQASAENFSLNNDQGLVDLTGSQLNAEFGEDGQLNQLNFSGSTAHFNDHKDLDFDLQNFNLNVDQHDDGSQNLNFTGQSLNLDTQSQQVHLDSIDQFNLQTNPDGSLSQANLHLGGNNTYTSENLNGSVQNLQGHYNQEGNIFSLNFDELKAQTTDIQIQATGGAFYHDDNLISLHLDSANIKQQLEQELNVSIERLDLIIDKTSGGQINSADLLVGSAEAQVAGMNAFVRTQNGDQVRLHIGLSEDGSYLQEAFLQIPEGGEIQIQKDDMDLRLGGGQKLSFEQDGQGYYTFKGEGLDLTATTADAKVSVQGGTAQVSLDSKNGNLIIDDITGVSISAEVAGQNINIDIAEMDGFLLKTTGISGLAQGAAIHFVPTGEDSKMTFVIRSEYNGLPISVSVDNAHELKALASIQTNHAHVYFGDPSGQGEVAIKAGPLEMSGSAIEYVVQYNQFDPMRMMTTLSRALSSDGYEIMKGVSLEMDGVLRMQTPFKSGPHAGLTLLFPRPNMSTSGAEQFYQPGQAHSEAGDGAIGAITELGWKHTNNSGTQYTGALHAGLVSGSYLGIHQLQGQTKIGGIPLPSNIEIPTTAIAGLTFRRHGDAGEVAKGRESRTDVMLGGYINPAGLADTPLIDEPNAYGVYAGAEWRNNRMSFGFSTTVDLSQDKPAVGGMLRMGISF